jgi:hypothetical protein
MFSLNHASPAPSTENITLLGYNLARMPAFPSASKARRAKRTANFGLRKPFRPNELEAAVRREMGD